MNTVWSETVTVGEHMLIETWNGPGRTCSLSWDLGAAPHWMVEEPIPSVLSERGPEEGPFRVIWELINNAGGYFTGVQSIMYLKPRAVFICGWMKTAPLPPQ